MPRSAATSDHLFALPRSQNEKYGFVKLSIYAGMPGGVLTGSTTSLFFYFDQLVVVGTAVSTQPSPLNHRNQTPYAGGSRPQFLAAGYEAPYAETSGGCLRLYRDLVASGQTCERATSLSQKTVTRDSSIVQMTVI